MNISRSRDKSWQMLERAMHETAKGLFHLLGEMRVADPAALYMA